MITTDSPNEVAMMREVINRKVKSDQPAEKARAREEQTRIAQKLQSDGSRHIPGIGQKMGSIDARTYFRHHQENPGCWNDPDYVDRTLRDSPKLQAPGYRPKKHYKPTYTIVYK